VLVIVGLFEVSRGPVSDAKVDKTPPIFSGD